MSRSGRVHRDRPAPTPRDASGAEAKRGRTSAAGPNAQLLRLQRSAGNAAVTRHLQRDGETGRPPTTPPVAAPPPVPATAPPRRNYVFLMGDTKRDAFYTAAAAFFAQHEPGAELVRDKRTLSAVIAHVNAGTAPALKIIIVSHANEAGNLGFSLNDADLKKDTTTGDKKPRTEFKELKAAGASGALPVADVAKIDASTRIDIKGCNIGRSKLMLNALDQAFGGAASVTAPTHKQEYSMHSAGKGKPLVTEEAMFQYSIEDPGHPTVGPADRATRFQAKYPAVPKAEWPPLLTAAVEHHDKRAAFVWRGPNPPKDDQAAVFARLDIDKRYPASAGWIVAYKGRSIVGDEYRYDVEATLMAASGGRIESPFLVVAIPPDGDTLRAKEIADSGRPDAYDWTVEDKVEPGNRLVRTVFAEHTEWVIDKKVVDGSGVAHPPTTDPTFYGQSTYAPPPPPPTP